MSVVYARPLPEAISTSRVCTVGEQPAVMVGEQPAVMVGL